MIQASAVIPTYNRRENLRNAILSAQRQTVPMEIVVMDDGSTDGTAEMIAGEFPQVIFEQHKGPNGPSFLRNRGSQLATSPILFPIDDDAIFASPKTVEQTLAEFDHPRVGAVAIPYINIRVSDVIHQQAPGDGRIHVAHAYVGASHALRRDVFLRLGGYRQQLFYMGEEGDFCIRLLNDGRIVRIGRADPIHHLESPNRSLFRADYYGRRNDVLFPFLNVPLPGMPLHLLITTWNGVKFGFKARRLGRMLRGLAAGWLALPGQWRYRKPVTHQTYALYRTLKKQPLPLDEIQAQLPPLAVEQVISFMP